MDDISQLVQPPQGDLAPKVDPQILADALQPASYQIISNLHGPLGTFQSRAEAFNFAKRMGIPTSGSGMSGGYFLKRIPIPTAPKG